MNRKSWIRQLITGVSFTSALFVFQACYGTPQDFGVDILVEGKVKSKSSGMPIQGIKVSVLGSIQSQLTDSQGFFSFYTERYDGLTLTFEDVDSHQNGSFLPHDTVIPSSIDSVFLSVDLNVKE
ncbi:MAG TPA: hypothetical protein PLQ09_09985 [Prolixibacteraceae bacterium]|nr:hypothetical protein [Prolixibacteraceae bacterium]HQN94438.1 hypothetical protein [Prolixibacteraceae bacterium]